jgi:hypothetical protein
VNETLTQALNRNARSRNPEPALDIISNPRFFNNNKLYADSFKYFISIGQDNCVQRDLSQDELLKMRTAYMNHCKNHFYTNQDFFNEIYALELTDIERVKNRTLTSKEKLNIKLRMAQQYEYRKKLFSSKKLPKLREIKDTRRNPLSSDRKRNLSLANFFADRFASIEAQKQVSERYSEKIIPFSHDDAAEKKQAEKQAYRDTRDELITLYRPEFKDSIVYYPPMNKQTKARIFALAAAGVVALGITHSVNTISKNNEFNHAYETAISQGITLEDMDLSTSLDVDTIKNASLGLDTSGYSESADIDQSIIELLESQGTIGLYNDIQGKLNYYNTHEASREEMDLFLREIQVLPNAVANDKIIAAYRQTDEGKYLAKDAGASISSGEHVDSSEAYTYYNVKINDSYSKKSDFSRAQYSSDDSAISFILGSNKVPKDLIKLIDADGKIDEFVSTFKKLEESLDDGIITEYDYLQKVGEAFNSGKIQNLIAPVENFAARDVTIKNKQSSSSLYNTTGKITTSKMDDEGR